MFHRFGFLILLIGMTSVPTYSSTSGVVGANVKAGDRSIEWRHAAVPQTGEIRSRVHYQHSLNDRWRPRAIIQFKDHVEDEAAWDYVRGELQWQFFDGARYDSAFRVGYNIRSDERAPRASFVWTSQYLITKRVYARLAFVSRNDFDTLEDEASSQIRTSISRKASSAIAYGFESFLSRSDWRDEYDEQSHVVGPYVKYRFLMKTAIRVGALVGVTGASDDQLLRFWLSHKI